MTLTLLFRLRRSKADAAEREILFARDEIEECVEDAAPDEKKPNLASLVADLEYLIREQLNERDRDEQFLDRVLVSARGKGKAKLQRENRFVQSVFDGVLRTHAVIKEVALLLNRHGYEVSGVEELDRATQDYRRWKEELPERLLLEYAPVKKVIQERLSEALKSPTRESDWRELFSAGGEHPVE